MKGLLGIRTGATLALLMCACADDPASLDVPASRVDDLAPATAIWETVSSLNAYRPELLDPSDGGGSAQLVLLPGEDAVIQVSSPRTWTIDFTVGPKGIQIGGVIHLMPEPFWGWTQPQTLNPQRLGFTTASTKAEGVQLDSSAGGGLFLATVEGRALLPGEMVRFVYGEGSGALSDRHSEAAARLWIAVDGNGDGIRKVLKDSPRIRVIAGPAAMLVAIAPTIMRPGEKGILHLSVLDALANRGVPEEGWLRVAEPDGFLKVQSEVKLESAQGGVIQVPFQALQAGTARVQVRFVSNEITLTCTSNPILVSDTLEQVLWADLHGHSGYSDGTGSPTDWFKYAREVAGLDVAALTDHDHWGVRFLDESPDLWSEINASVAAAHEPGKFVALSAYEWTSWIHGHRHVLHFADEGPLLSSHDPRYETPRQLWAGLSGLPALTFAHHSSGAPIPTNWTFAADPILEPLTEVASVHGSSEAADGAPTVRGSRAGRFVRDQLDAGMQLGFVGSGDGHDGHPGLTHLSPLSGARPRAADGPQAGSGGLAAIFSNQRTRLAVLEAMRARRTYATSGPRIHVVATLNGQVPGESVEPHSNPAFTVTVTGTAEMKRIVLVRDGQVTDLNRGPTGEPFFSGSFELPLGSWTAGSYAYLRIEQADGAWAWTSPWFAPAQAR